VQHIFAIGREGVAAAGVPKTPGHKLWRAVVDAAAEAEAAQSTTEMAPTNGGAPGSVLQSELTGSSSSSRSRESTAGSSSNGRLVRGVGEARLRAARAVVDADGAFAWERGPWSTPATNACALLKELLPSVFSEEGGDSSSSSSSTSSSSGHEAWSREPPMAKVLRNCPNMATCLKYGEVREGLGKRCVVLSSPLTYSGWIFYDDCICPQ